MDQLKKPSVSPSSSWQDEGLEFELTDLEEARRILDSESVSQFDVARVMPPEHWNRLRRGKLPTDRALGELFVRHRDQYNPWRNTLAMTTGACLLIRFWRVAPPRLMPSLARGEPEAAETSFRA